MRAATIGAAALGAVLLAAAAGAHALLDRADPPAGATLKSPPGRVIAWFTHALEPAYSRLQVFDGQGQRVDAGDSRLGDADPSILTVSLKRALASGPYLVKWRVVSIDAHVTEGDFTFTVK